MKVTLSYHQLNFMKQLKVMLNKWNFVFVCHTDKAASFELGYKSFMHEIYGDNILFSDGELK